MGMITHGTHHLALMVMIGKQLRYKLHKDFGKARLPLFTSAASLKLWYLTNT